MGKKSRKDTCMMDCPFSFCNLYLSTWIPKDCLLRKMNGFANTMFVRSNNYSSAFPTFDDRIIWGTVIFPLFFYITLKSGVSVSTFLNTVGKLGTKSSLPKPFLPVAYARRLGHLRFTSMITLIASGKGILLFVASF